MTAIRGADGSVTISESIGGVLRFWTATAQFVVSEVTSFSDTLNRRFLLGIPTISGTISGTMDDTLAPGADSPDVDGDTLTLTAQTGNTWALTAIFPGRNLASNQVGDAEISFDFINGDDDDFAETWS